MEYYLFDNSIEKNPIKLGQIDFNEFIWNCDELNEQYKTDFKQGDFKRIFDWLETKVDAGCYITNETIYNIFNIDSFKKIVYDSTKLNDEIGIRILNILEKIEDCLDKIEERLAKI